MWRFRNRMGLREIPSPTPFPKVAADERIYAIGDIHGQMHCFDALIERIERDSARRRDHRRTRIVLLGDYIDRGLGSRAVLDRVATLVDGGAVALMGNHEAAALRFLDDPRAGAIWFDFGGRQTLASYGLALPHRPNPRTLVALAAHLRSAMGPHVPLLRDRLVNHARSGDVVFAHADLTPGVDLEAQEEKVMVWGDSRIAGAPWRAGTLLVHGHYPAPEPRISEGRICVDTGAFYTGTLTCVRLDDEVTFITNRDDGLEASSPRWRAPPAEADGAPLDRRRYAARARPGW